MTIADEADWDKGGGLLPAVVQDADRGTVLMLGYMNRDALAQTEHTGRVTFWSRSKGRLWTKGETSGHSLELVAIALDCDRDTLLVLARPQGPVCHRNTPTCFGESPPRAAAERIGFLPALERLIDARLSTRPEGSYTARLAAAGPLRIAQKVGEEGLELALAAAAEGDAKVLEEAADLFYHALVLLRSRGLRLEDVVAVLEARHARVRGTD